MDKTEIIIKKHTKFVDEELVETFWEIEILKNISRHLDCSESFKLFCLDDLKLLKEKIDEAILKEEVK